MDVVIDSIQNNLSNAFFFLFPLLGSILYFQMRTRIENKPITNLFYGFLSMIGLLAFVISIYGAVYSLGYGLGLFQSATNSQIILVGLTLIFFTMVYSSLERQYLQNKRLGENPKEYNRQQMVESIAKVTRAARTDMLMFCGTMSFIEEDYSQFSHLKTSSCRVKALCKKPKSLQAEQRYELARNLGIEIRYYPEDELDPGIRGRVIDPNNFDNAISILISKQLEKSGDIKYLTTLLVGKTHTLETGLLSSLFQTLWLISDVR